MRPQAAAPVAPTPQPQPQPRELNPIESYLREPADPNESELHKWAKAYGVIFKNAPRLIGSAIGLAGKGLEATAGKIAGTGDTLEDVIGAVTRGKALPVEEAAQTVEGVPGFGARAGLGVLETIPKLGLLAAFPESLLAQSIAAGGIFGLDAQGNFSPKAAVIGALLPGAGKIATDAVRGALTRGVLGGAESLVKNKTAQWFLEETGRQAALNAVMLAGDSPELIALYKQDPQAAKKQVQEIFGQNLAWALFGAGRHFALGENTATSAWVEGQKRKYSSYFDADNFNLVRRGLGKAVDEVKEKQAEPPPAEEPPREPSETELEYEGGEVPRYTGLPERVGGRRRLTLPGPAAPVRRINFPMTVTKPLTPGAPYAITQGQEPQNRELQYQGATQRTTVPANAPEVRSQEGAGPGGGNLLEGSGDVAPTQEAAAELPVAPSKPAAREQGITDEDGLLKTIVDNQKLPAFLPGKAWETKYAKIMAKKRSNAPLTSAEKDFLANEVPQNYEDYWGDDFKRAYAAAKEAGIEGELFEPVKATKGAKINDAVWSAIRVTGRDMTPNELWDRVAGLANAKAERSSKAAAEEKRAEQAAAWGEATTTTKPRKKGVLVDPARLDKGDSVVIEGERVPVLRKTTKEVVLDGGEKFGAVTLRLPGEKFYAQKFEAGQKELLGGGLGELKPAYGLAPEDVAATGGVKEAIDVAAERLSQEAKRERASDVYDWNTSNKRWGQVWTEVKQDPTTRQWRVISSLEGNLKGLDVAEFGNEEAARAFAKDFREGKSFALINGDRWRKLVESADQTKRFTTNDKELLLSRGRTQGTTTEGQTVGVEKLKQQYEPPAADRYRIKNAGPQTYVVTERLEQTSAEKELGEQPVRVRNEATGDIQTVLESDLEAVRTRTEEEKVAEKRLSKKELDDELRKFGVSDPSIFPKMADKRAALKRYQALKGQKGGELFSLPQEDVPWGFWIGPTGEMLPVKMMMHDLEAKRLLVTRGLPYDEYGAVAGFQLEKAGYVRAVFDRKNQTLFVDSPNPLSNTVRRAIKDYAIEHNISAVFGADTSISGGGKKFEIYRGEPYDRFALGETSSRTIESATKELTGALGLKSLPQNLSVVHQPEAPWGARIVGRNRIEINAARVRQGNVMRVALEEGLHGVWGDSRFVKEWKDISDSLTAAELAAERGRREKAGLPADEETIREEAAIRKLLEQPESSWAKRVWTAIVNAFKRVFGIEIKPTDREVLLGAAKEFLRGRRESLPGKRLVADNAVVIAPGVSPAYAITAFHGTPHSFERFTTAKIGTGEGAQVYGWGLYFAENRAVAFQYQTRLGKLSEVRVGGRLIDFNQGNSVSYAAEKLAHLHWAKTTLGEPISEAQIIASVREDMTVRKRIAEKNKDIEVARSLDRQLAALANMEREGIELRPSANLLKVALNVEPDELLDWDKKLSEQSGKIQKLLEGVLLNYTKNYTGAQLHHDLIYGRNAPDATAVAESLGHGDASFPEKASIYLSSKGIKGIRYADQGSRYQEYFDRAVNKWVAGPSGDIREFNTEAEARAYVQSSRTYNYVIFNENDITITHRNGQAVALPDAMAAKQQEVRYSLPEGDRGQPGEAGPGESAAEEAPETKVSQVAGERIGPVRPVETIAPVVQALKLQVFDGDAAEVTPENLEVARNLIYDFTDPNTNRAAVDWVRGLTQGPAGQEGADVAAPALASELWRFAMRVGARNKDFSLARLMIERDKEFALIGTAGSMSSEQVARALRGRRLLSDELMWRNLIALNDARNRAVGRQTGVGAELIDQLEATLRETQLSPDDFEKVLQGQTVPGEGGKPGRTIQQVIEELQPETKAADELVTGYKPVETQSLLETVEQWRGRPVEPADEAAFIAGLRDALVARRLPLELAQEVAEAAWVRKARSESRAETRKWASTLQKWQRQLDEGANAEAILDRWSRQQTEWLQRPQIPNNAKEAVTEFLRTRVNADTDEADFRARLEQRLLSVGVPEPIAIELGYQTWNRKLRLDRNRLEAGLEEVARDYLRERGELRSRAAMPESAKQRFARIIANAMKPLSAGERAELRGLVARPDPRAPLTAEQQARLAELRFRDERDQASFQTTLQARLEAAGLLAAAAERVSRQAWNDVLLKWADVQARAIDRATQSTSTKGLIEEILSNPSRAQSDPAWRAQAMQNWLVRNGLSVEQAKEAARISSDAFEAAMTKVIQDKARQFLQGRAQPKSIEDIVKALRLGLYDPNRAWSDEIAARQGYRPVSPDMLSKVAALEEKLSDPRLSLPEYVATLEKIHGFWRVTSAFDGSLSKAIAEWHAANLLIGLRTLGLHIFQPPMSILMRDFPVAALFQPLDAPMLAKVLLRQATRFYPRFRYAWQNDAYVISRGKMRLWHEELKRQFELGQQEIARGETKGWLRMTYSWAHYVTRFLQAATEAGSSIVREWKVAAYASMIMRDAGLKTREISQLADVISEGKKTAYEANLLRGLDENTAAIAADYTYDDAVRRFMQNKGFEDSMIEKLFQSSDFDTNSTVGYVAPGLEKTAGGEIDTTQGWGWEKIPYGMMRYVSKIRQQGGWQSVGGIVMFGFFNIPTRIALYGLNYTPYGLLRAGVYNYRMGNIPFLQPGKYRGVNPWPQMFANDVQAKQRFREAVVGSALMTAGLAWAMYNSSADDDVSKKNFGVYVTGDGPRSKTLRDAWEKLGFKPKAINIVIGGQVRGFIPITRSGSALAAPMAILASHDDVMWVRKEAAASGRAAKETINAEIVHAIGAYAGVVGAQGALQGVSHFLKLTEGAGSAATATARVIADLGSGLASAILVPGKQMWDTLDKLIWGSPDRSSIQSIIASNFPIVGHIPFLSSVLGKFHPALNRFGDPLHDQTWFGRATMLNLPVAFKVSDTPENRALYEMLVNKGVSAPELRRSVIEERYGPLTEDQWQKFVQISGSTLKKAVVSDLEGLKSLPPEQLKSFLTKIGTQANLQAAAELGLERVPQPGRGLGGGGGAGIATFTPPGGGGRAETPRLTLPRVESGLGPAAGGGGGGVGLPRIAAGAFASAAPRLTLPIAARSAGLGGRLAAGTGQPRRITSLGAPRGAGRRRLAYVSGRLRSRGGRLRASLGRGRARATTARAPGGYRERSRAAYHALRRRFAA